jgi:hypothetical protein
LNRQLLRVYDLQPAYGRLDSTTASGHWTLTADSLFQLGHRKDHHPGQPQVKGRRSVLEPMGMPVATDMVPGQRADDPLYVPAIVLERERLGRRGGSGAAGAAGRIVRGLFAMADSLGGVCDCIIRQSVAGQPGVVQYWPDGMVDHWSVTTRPWTMLRKDGLVWLR